jgi:hypothetical protein
LDEIHRVHELLCVSTVTNAHHDVSLSHTSQVAMHPFGSLAFGQAVPADLVHVYHAGYR